MNIAKNISAFFGNLNFIFWKSKSVFIVIINNKNNLTGTNPEGKTDATIKKNETKKE